MAFVQLVPQQNFSSPRVLPPVTSGTGTPGVSQPVLVPAGTQRVTMRLTSSNWPTGTGQYVTYGIDLSRDGGTTWEGLLPPVDRPEGGLAKDGSLPSDSWMIGQDYPPITTDCHIRARYAVPAGTLRFGVEWEVV
jgi:hypothetical protein